MRNADRGSSGPLAKAVETWGICTRRAGKLYKARSRLYRRRFLQVNTRWKALAEIYTMHSFAPLLESIIENCSLISKISLKIAENLLIFDKIAKLASILLFFFGRMRLKKHSEKTDDARPKREQDQRKRGRASSGTRKSSALSHLN